jgi:uncharacterized protein (TIGR02300 family)
VAKPELGNKHQCEQCGVCFFDLNKSPITCPKCGTVVQAAPLSRATHRAAVADEDESEARPVAELVSLKEPDAGADTVPATADDDVEIEAGDDTLLEEEEEDSDEVGDLIYGEIGDEEER